MAFSFFDSRVVPGWGDPAVLDATPGCISLERSVFPRHAGTGGGGLGLVIIEPGTQRENRSIIARIPPSYVDGGVEAYWRRVSAIRRVPGQTQLDTSTILRSGTAPSVPLAPEAIDKIGVVLLGSDGKKVSFSLSDLNDTTVPYISNTFVPDGALAYGNRVESSIIIVDKTHPNVSFQDQEFLQFRPGPDTNLGNDRFLSALVDGDYHLSLHSAAPPTAANQVVGVGYSSVPISLNGWTFVDGENHREARNLAPVDFGRPGNVWTTIRYVALWTAANARGTWRWYGPSLQSTPRPGQPNVVAAIGAIRIAAPNIRA